MRFVRAFGRFCYEFVIGDDPKIAAAVVLALAALFGFMSAGWFGDHVLAVIGAALIVVLFSASLCIEAGRSRQ